MKSSKKSTKYKHRLSIKTKQLIFYISIGVMGLGLVSFSFSNKDSEVFVPNSSDISSTPVPGIASSTDRPSEHGAVPTDVITPTCTPTATMTPTPTPIPNPLDKDAYPEINELIEAYYNAKLTCREEDFIDLVTDISYINFDDLRRQYEYVRSFDSIECYTKRATCGIDLVVYVRYEMKISTIDTALPQLDLLPIVCDEDGNPRICLEESSADLKAFYRELDTHEDVIELYSKVKADLDAAIASDEKLRLLYSQLDATSNNSGDNSTGDDAE